MLRRFLLVASFGFAALCALPAAASQTVGSADGGNCYPFSCNDGAASMDYYEIYSASAFSGPLTFDTITFFSDPNVISPASILSGTYTISFGTTSAAVGSGYPVLPLDNVAAFFSGPLSGPNLSITGAAYSYNPADGNLVMHLLSQNQPPLYNEGQEGLGYMVADYSGADVSRAFSVDPQSGNVDGDVGALVTQFSSSGAVPEPATWALMLVGFGVLGGALRVQRRRVGVERRVA